MLGLFNATLAPLLALVLIFEEWGWEPLANLIGRLARLPLWARMEAWIAALPPYAALVLYLVPIVLLLPIKLLALYWIQAGYVALGLALVCPLLRPLETLERCVDGTNHGVRFLVYHPIHGT